MYSNKNIVIPGFDNYPIGIDIFFENDKKPLPTIIYVHGFNGFKDWGNFDLIAQKFAKEGFFFIKFNFSHNGTSPKHPEEFVDLEAFGKNNYSKELADLQTVMNWACNSQNPYHANIDKQNISLIGHSLGGGISIIYAKEDKQVHKLITWAGISECNTPWGNWSSQKLEEWKRTGVEYYTNGRTQQQMPLYYQLYEDFYKNRDRLNIRDAISDLNIPVLICHGTIDQAVSIQQAYDLITRQPNATLFTVHSDHVFDRKHPWTNNWLPDTMNAVIEESIRFLKK